MSYNKANGARLVPLRDASPHDRASFFRGGRGERPKKYGFFQGKEEIARGLRSSLDGEGSWGS